MTVAQAAAEKKKLADLQKVVSSFWLKEVVPGGRVVQTSSGVTGEIRKVTAWGVEVWSANRKGERELWSWSMITKRNPRAIKRYPRPFRFARMEPTKQCHCKSGKMTLTRGGESVRCSKCKQLIGNESFPNRIKWATKLIRTKALSRKPRKQAAEGVVRPKPTAPRRAKVQRRESRSGVGVRRSRTRKKSPSTPKARPKAQVRRKKAPAVSPVQPKARARRPLSIPEAAPPGTADFQPQGIERGLPSEPPPAVTVPSATEEPATIPGVEKEETPQ